VRRWRHRRPQVGDPFILARTGSRIHEPTLEPTPAPFLQRRIRRFNSILSSSVPKHRRDSFANASEAELESAASPNLGKIKRGPNGRCCPSAVQC
jgi:hypothetical protein